ncbi:DUF4394 domain-containing protein [Luteolibacter ambystomatis]|uniref:DUF4394 domain-containing protein n=1 Tax=Luteolibacter ambystomatis TaxID=2824561 RepID=A0A975PGL6_9BACT|nr:DUF4394 domain-containing protein [Luteolibacter ambystomatis]QUE52854.1 DUF4394 domain-containing protein [Luteolibacter ambystomatis]
MSSNLRLTMSQEWNPSCRLRSTLLRLALLTTSSLFATQAGAETLHLLTDDGKLSSVLTTSVTTPTAPVSITGITAGESVVGISVRPQNQLLYALGVNSVADTASLYVVDPKTGFASLIGNPGQISFTTNGVTVVDFPDPAVVKWGFDFNPAVDRIRVTAGSLNFRVNPNNAAPVDGDNGGAVTAGTNPDGAINGGSTTVAGVAYTNDVPNNGGITTQYTIDDASNRLFIQNLPNSGTQTLGQNITLGGPALDIASSSFSIAPGVNAPASNTAVTTGSGFLASKVGGGTTKLFSLDLVTAQATLLGDTGLSVRGIAVLPGSGAAIALPAGGGSLIRLNPATPTTTTTVALGALTAGETLVGITSRPQTGQLYGLGINATANNGTLYLIDPQTAGVTAVGAASSIAFTTDGVTVVDLPDPATAGYGLDFNPTVDRIRVVTTTGLNFRLNPITGAAVDGDTSITGTNPDGVINGSGVVGLRSAAYTNSFNQNLTGGVTTLYTVDPISGSLYIQVPPNNGTQTSPLPITLGGPALAISTFGGFDIPHSVSVASSNTAATGEGLFTSQVGGIAGLYRVNLATGASTALGNIGTGATPITSLVVWATNADLSVENPAGTVVADNASTATFPNTLVGMPVTKQITLRNLGSEPLTYSTSFTTGTEFSATGNGSGTVPGSSSVVLTLTFNPTSMGIKNDTLHILSNDPDVASFEVALTGNALIPQTNDSLFSTTGETRFNPLANDTLPGDLLISAVSDPAIQIVDGRTLIIPAGYTGQFTYTISVSGTDTGLAVVDVVGSLPSSVPKGYNGVLTDVSDKVKGWAQAKLNKNGVGTIKIVTGNSNTSTRITFPTGSTSINVATALGNLNLDRSLNGVLLFSLNGGTLEGTLHAEPPLTNSTGTHHIALRSIDPVTFPGGGYATAVVTRNGATNLRGLLPDGNPFTAATALTDNFAIAFFTSNITGVTPSGFVGGDLTLWANTDTDVTGELVWSKPPQGGNAKGTHLTGVDTTLTANGSLFFRNVPYANGSTDVELAGGNLAVDETGTVPITNGVPGVPTGSLLTWSINRGAGTFTFTVFDPVLNKAVRGSGLYLQKSDGAIGYFPGSTIGGRVVLSPTPPPP